MPVTNRAPADAPTPLEGSADWQLTAILRLVVNVRWAVTY